MKEIHTFIGIPIKGEMKQSGKALQKKYQLSKYYKKISEVDDFHITLLFIGSCDSEKRVELWKTLEKKCKAYFAFLLKFTHIDVFGKNRQPHVFHVVPELETTLFQLESMIKEEAAYLGFPVSKAPFQPHITLAKKWKDNKLSKPDHWDFPIRIVEKQFCRISEICLYEIKPFKEPMYEVISSIKFSDES